MMNYIEEYYNKIIAGEIITSKRVQKQYEKLVYKIHNPDTYIFNREKAERPIKFIETWCRQSKGEWAGKPIKLLLFQKAFISALFGFVHKDTGLRQYKESMLFVSRKNGKSLLLSAIALYMLMADGEGGAEIYSCASKKDQARIVFDETHKMIQQSESLSKHIKKRKTDLYFPATMGKFQPLGKNSDTLDGLNSHLVIIDECHSIKDRNLYEVLKQSTSARQQALIIIITTAGTIRECIFDDMYEYACNLVDEVFQDETFLPILYELDNKDEWLNESCWMKANPALGAIKKVDDLRQKVAKAKNVPKDINGILVKDFNIRETASNAWLNLSDFTNKETFDLEEFRGSYAIGGVDLGAVSDLTCASILLMKKDSNKKYVHQMYWMPRSTYEERLKLSKLPWRIWVEKGYIRICEGNANNTNDVTKWFLELVNDYGIIPYWNYYDPWLAATWIEEMKANAFDMVKCKQWFSTLSQPMKVLESDFKAGNVVHNSNPVLLWCLSNTAIKEDDAGNIRPIKSASSKMKIDGLAAALNSWVGLQDHQEEFKRAL